SVQKIDVADDQRNITLAIAAATTAVVQVGSTAGLVPGQRVLLTRLTPLNPPDVAIIRSVDSGTQVTLTAQMPNAHGVNDFVIPQAKVTTEPIAAGGSVLAVDDRMGLTERDIVRVGVAPDDEFAVIELIPNRAPGG